MTAPTAESNPGNATLAAALAYVRAGISFLPIKKDGTKAPDVKKWKSYTRRPPAEAEALAWFDRSGPPGIGLIGGAVSGGLECIDFDGRAEATYPVWRELVEAEAPDLADKLSVVRTPRPGYHVRYRCTETTIPGNTKLASDPSLPAKDRCLIETRGEGGYAVAPGSPPECHETGRPYEHVAGPPVAEIQTIAAAEREILWRCARSFNLDVGGKAAPKVVAPAGPGLLPGTDYNRRGPDWPEILDGWTLARGNAGGRRYWRRPGKDGPGWSATTGVCRNKEDEDLFYCFSANAAPFEGGSPYTKFAAYALIRHGGDFKAAAKELARQGYGERAAKGGAAKADDAAAKDLIARVLAAVAADGAGALFADQELLGELSRLGLAAYAVARAALRGKVNLRDLDAALKQLRREEEGKRANSLLAEARYCTDGGRLCRKDFAREGPAVPMPLCNFTAKITEAVVCDDGAEQKARFTLAGVLADGRELPAVQVPAGEFAGMAWVTTAWHGDAVVYAGQGVRDHLRAAIEILSVGRARRTVYGHTGWRRIGDAWRYLHGGGAIGRLPDGPDGSDGFFNGVEVALDGPLAGFRLPDPPAGAALAKAVRASLALLLDGLAPDRIMFPLLGATYRAALGEAPGPIDLAVHMTGPHGVGKSELAALAQQHFGAGLDARHLPGSWTSTANGLEEQAFCAKDALLAVDDYAPRGGPGDRQRLEAVADRVFRSQGNRSGRQRSGRNGGLRPAKPPRGLILSTGEDAPPGQSLRGRMLIVEVSPGDVSFARLTAHQRAAKDGLLAGALAGFVRWLALRYGELCQLLPGERALLRDRATTGKGSSRTPGVVADLALGLKCFLDFAVAAGVVAEAGRAELARRGWQALQAAAETQAEHVGAAEPTAVFLRLLAGTIGTTAYIARPGGQEPESNPQRWGWSLRTYGVGQQERTDWYPCQQGKRVGWVDGPDLYLEPEASYAAAQDLAHRQGDALPVTARTLWKRLREKGLLVSWDAVRQRNTVRRAVEGHADHEVIHLRAAALSLIEPSEPSGPSGSPPEPHATSEKPDGCEPGDPDGCAGGPENRPEEPSGLQGENGQTGRSGRSGRLFALDAESPPTAPATGLHPLRATSSPRPRTAPAINGNGDGGAHPAPPPAARLTFQDANGRPCDRAAARLWTWEGGPRWYYVDRDPPP